jgi:hypothetical protein
MLWLAIGLPYVAIVVLVMQPRIDLAIKLSDTRFLLEEIAAVATAIAASVAAFSLTIPGNGRKFIWVPVVPLAVWLATLGQGCVQDWLQFGADGLKLRPDWFCFPAILLVGTVPSVAMVIMLRRGAPLSPHLTVAMGALAAAALGNFGLRLFHPQDASLMVLFWQFGSVALISVCASWMGPRVLNWRNVIAAKQGDRMMYGR